jgi:hypothetical protein
MPLEVPDRDDWFPSPNGLPQPDWLAINGWISNVVSPNDRREAAEQITRYWLARVAAGLESPHSIAESEHYFVLSTRDKKGRAKVLEFLDESRDYVFRTTGKTPPIRRERKLVFLRLPTMDHVYEVQDSIHRDARAARIFFGAGSLPVTYCEDRTFDWEYRWMAHGVPFHFLGHLHLPAWLYCGLGTALYIDLAGGRFAVLDEDLLEVHHHCWTEESIQDFWSGNLFAHEEWRELAYNLADVLMDIVRRELRPDAGKLQRFFQEASREDAGEAAAQRFWGVGLGEIATVFLGEGDWSPKPATWKKREE